MKKWIAVAALLLAAPLFGAEKETFTINDLSKGMYSYPPSNRIPDNAAAYIQNFLTDEGNMANERPGYVKRDATVLGGAKPAYGSWTFIDNGGNEWYITYSSRTFYKNTTGGTPTAFGLVSTVDQIPDCASNLGLFMCVNGTDAAWTFNGTSTASISGAPLGTLIEPWRTRFAIAHIGGALTTIRFSADGSATNWTLGGLPTDPFSLQIGGANDGDYIRCLVGSYQDSMIVGRKFDMWAVDGFDQADVETRNVSRNVGCIEWRTPQEVDDELIWISARGLESMKGRTITLISEPVRDITDILAANTVNEHNNTQTSQSDFGAGSISPAGKLSTSISPGNVVLSTMAVIVSSDDTQANFGLGTLTNLSTTYSSGDLMLARDPGSVGTVYSCTSGTNQNGSGCGCYTSQSFYTGFAYSLSSVTIHLSVTSPAPNNGTLALKDDSGGSPGSTLATIGTVSWASITTSASGADYTFTLGTPYALSANTTYWVTLTASGCQSTAPGICNGPSNKLFYDYFTNTPCNTTNQKYRDTHANQEQNFSLAGTNSQFFSTGSITSRTFDMGVTTQTWLWNWGTLSSVKSMPTGSTITWFTQSSANGSSWESAVPVADGAVTTSTVQQYIRYVATFSVTDRSTTPVVNSITLNAGPFITTGGIYTSQLLTIGSNITSWGPVTISNTQSSGTITYQFGSTTTASVAGISNWTTITNGGIPTVSTNPYAAFRSSFTPTNASANLSLAEFQTTWREGGVVVSPVATVHDRRYWLSFTTNTASNAYLDTVLLWQRNKSFSIFKGINAGSFTRWRDSLYFGNSDSTGYVYKYGVGNNDDGTAITSLIKTKSYDLGASYRPKTFRTLYVGYLGNTSYTGNFSASYDLDRYASAYSLGTADLSTAMGQLSVKFPFSLSNLVEGREIQFTLNKSGTGDRLKLYDLTTVYRLKEEP